MLFKRAAILLSGMLILLGLSAIMASSALAETTLTVGGPSFHVSGGSYPNSFHRTAVISHNNYFAGYFRNSFDDDSFTLGRTFVHEKSDFDAILHTGLVWGYRKSGSCYKRQRELANDPKILCPMLAPGFVLKRVKYKPSFLFFGLDAVTANITIPLDTY